MRPSLRFFSNCSTSSVIGGILQTKIVARDAAQNHPLQPVEIVKPILGGFAGGGKKWLARILAQQAQQLPQRKARHFAALLLDRKSVV